MVSGRKGFGRVATANTLRKSNVILWLYFGNPAGIYLLKVNNRNTRTRCEICSKLTIKTPERRSGVFIVNFEHISHLVLVFLLLTLNMQLPAGNLRKLLPANVDVT